MEQLDGAVLNNIIKSTKKHKILRNTYLVVHKKNCDPLVLGPEFAILSIPGPVCRNVKFSSSNFLPYIDLPPVPLYDPVKTAPLVAKAFLVCAQSSEVLRSLGHDVSSKHHNDSAQGLLAHTYVEAFAEVYKKKTKNAWQMYESRHLLTARAVRAGDFTYIKCQCMASMKKIFYVVDIKLRNACGSIEETHCECAVGSGHEAHCKHVLVALYGIAHMVQDKCILLHRVCTQKLMTFKRPKPFYSSPLKCDDLPRKQIKYSINYEPINVAVLPKSYADYVRNLIINYGQTSAPLKQTYAIECDHSYYEKKTGEQLTIERLHLDNVTQQQLIIIEENTREQNNCKFWKELHETHLTAKIAKGMSKKLAAKTFQVPRSTIQFRLKNPKHGCKPTILNTEEEALVNWIKVSSRKGFPKRKEDLTSVSEFLKKINRKNKINNIEQGELKSEEAIELIKKIWHFFGKSSNSNQQQKQDIEPEVIKNIEDCYNLDIENMKIFINDSPNNIVEPEHSELQSISEKNVFEEIIECPDEQNVIIEDLSQEPHFELVNHSVQIHTTPEDQNVEFPKTQIKTEKAEGIKKRKEERERKKLEKEKQPAPKKQNKTKNKAKDEITKILFSEKFYKLNTEDIVENKENDQDLIDRNKMQGSSPNKTYTLNEIEKMLPELDDDD
ncbi:hypothetical protein HW555_013261 [Spodoptera exigua]|uniref:SWIM-type domain-containing protein n=1 Tax=Spodoptera exigua TaxID=7107 RepID=A0A835G4E3_SPOEX|nr:hypothetical protein HW555_013261 [Spodoptera exigua]